MSFLNTLIDAVRDEDSRERLHERVDIIQHKIKFMDRVSVVFLDTDNHVSYNLTALLGEAGGSLQDDPMNARVVIYAEQGYPMLQLMGIVPALMKEEWPAVEFSRVYLWDDNAALAETAEQAVTAMEDLAEMLYPGYFVFGNEGQTWISFKTK
ncbi:hypothetical protein [Pedobacter sp. JCM 36344]|uniref:hypothetical protein n=1 Tax=Pedobacter sp. JCM 36344 TaxID=3374280 RepID=UPI00397911D8